MTFPVAEESIVRNLRESVRSYIDHGAVFTRVLSRPVLLQVAGIYGCLIFSYLAIEIVITRYADLFGQNPAAIFIVILPIALGMIFLFCRGFWEYMVYMVSLCRNTEEALNNQSPDFRAAYTAVSRKSGPYTGYLLILVGLQLIPVLCGGLVMVLAMALGTVLGPAVVIFVMVAGGLLSGVALLAALVVTVYVSLGFQVLAFEEVKSGLVDVPKRSIALVKGCFWRTAGLQTVWMLLTGLIIPGLATVLLQLLGMIGLLNTFHHWVLALILDQAQPLGGGLDPIPNYENLYSMINAARPIVAESLSSILISTVVTLLLLPLGTFSFTRLYLSIRNRGL